MKRRRIRRNRKCRLLNWGYRKVSPLPSPPAWCVSLSSSYEMFSWAILLTRSAVDVIRLLYCSHHTPNTQGPELLSSSYHYHSVWMLTSRFNWIGTPKYDEDGFPRSNKCPVVQSDPNPRRRWVTSISPSFVLITFEIRERGAWPQARGWRIGMYKGGQFKFTFNINPNYPHEPPKVLCTQKVCLPHFQ